MLKKKSVIFAITLAVIAVLTSFAYIEYIYPEIIEPAEIYSQAKSLYNGGNYMQAALKLESIPAYSDSANVAKRAWKYAGDSAYNNGKFDMASACYIKAGSNEEDVARMDDCYIRLAEKAFYSNMGSRGEIYLQCVSLSDANKMRMDDIRIRTTERILNGELNDENIMAALERLQGCTDATNEKAVELIMNAAKKELDGFKIDSASSLFAAARQLCDSSSLNALTAKINYAWNDAGNRALNNGEDAIAQRCFEISGYVSQGDNVDADYKTAQELYQNGKLFEAFSLLRKLGNNEISKALNEEIANIIRCMPSAGKEQTYAVIDVNGTVRLIGSGWEGESVDWKNIKQIAVGKTRFILGVDKNGKVFGAGKNTNGCLDVASWSGVAQTAGGKSHSMGLCSNGTVLFAGTETAGKATVSTWENIVSIAAGSDASYGVLQNGAVLAAGDNTHGQCNVETWADVTMVSGGDQHAVALRKDGTLVACGDNTYGQCDVSNWKDIVFVSAGAFHTVALKSDGTLLACGKSDNGECAVSSFKGVAAVSAGRNYTFMIFEDGTNRVIG